jgi:hypothetical protein
VRIRLTVSISSAVSGSSGCRTPTLMCSAVVMIGSLSSSRRAGFLLVLSQTNWYVKRTNSSFYTT